MTNHSIAFQDTWQNLKQFTPARIALGRAGMSLPTQACLEFALAHAQARDAVNIPLNFDAISQQLKLLGQKTLLLQTQANDQNMYLQRPDLGRLLNENSLLQLHNTKQASTDVVIVVADGLSSKAIEHHAEPFLSLLLPCLKEENYALLPICLVKHGRVAVGDTIAQCYLARLCIVLIGERPGLSSPDSMGIYFTYQAKQGISTDADRNCISNIHHNGLSYTEALKKLLYLVKEAEKRQLSGVSLKDETTNAQLNYGF